MFFRHLDNRSLGRRLGIGLAAGLVVIFILQTTAVFWIAYQLAEQNVLEHLRHESETLLAMTSIRHHTLHIDHTFHALQYHRPFSGHYYQLRSNNGSPDIRSRSLWDANLPDNHLQVGASQAVRRQLFGQSLLILHSAYERDGELVRITVAEEMDHQNHLTRQLMLADAVVFAVAMLLLWWWQQWTLHRAMGVLQRLRQDMQELWDGRRDRLPTAHIPMELSPLVEEFNYMIERLQQRMQRTRNALGDLAHSLKTPLARIHQLLDNEPFDARARQQLRRASEQIHQRIEHELRIAQLSGIRTVPDRLPLHKEASELIEAMRTLYPQQHIVLDCPAMLCLMVDREDILELLGNVLDNACKWARSYVSLKLVWQDGELVVTVEDDGPGMPEEELASLPQRGVRLDERKQGHGLGLSIVAAILAEYNGRWQLQRSSQLGGACVCLYLPVRRCAVREERNKNE